MQSSDPWQIRIEQQDARTARVVFAPKGTLAGPTFAVREPRFTPLPIPDSGQVRVCGGQVTVTVQPDGQPPHRDNLNITWVSGGQERSWRPGDLDHENLGASFTALDNLWRDYIPSGVHTYDPMIGLDQYAWNMMTLTWELEVAIKEARGDYPKTEDRNDEVARLMRNEPPQLLPDWPQSVLKAREIVRRSPPGLLSRSGLALFRDDTPPWNPATQWIESPPPPQPYVFYLVYHDCNWKQATASLTQLLGPVPSIPACFLGIWYSNYRRLGAEDFKRIVADFAQYDLPLDVISVDMDWHGQKWYGYEWNRELFPDPAAFGKWKREQELRATFNVHPLYIPKTDSRLAAFVEATDHGGHLFGESGDWYSLQADCLGIDIHDQRQVQTYLDMLHRPIEQDACDFWWIDGWIKRPDGRDSCSWLNHIYRAHLAAQEGRIPIVLARAGGLGGHRDAIVFTGDACSQWEVLAFEVETLVRASGSLMAYISHDIGGFYHDPKDRKENKPPDDLYARWVQFGCLSPIMRLHSFNGVREPWKFSENVLAISRRFFELRMRLLPETTRLVDEAHRTGVPPCRPLWFEFDDDDAYKTLHQYMLGESLLVVPVVREDATVRYWLPPGRWHHAFKEQSVDGPQWMEQRVALDIIPLWLRDGATLELAEPAPRTAQALAGPRHTVGGAAWA
jgi:hypothetical protein